MAHPNLLPPSPRRRRILSSVNPLQDHDAAPRPSGSMADRMADDDGTAAAAPGRGRLDSRPSSHDEPDLPDGPPGQHPQPEDRQALPPRHPQPEDRQALPPRPSRLRLKSEKSRHRRTSQVRHHRRGRAHRSDAEPSMDSRTSTSKPRRHGRHHPRHRHHRDRSHDATPLDPEAAFRESLFDAMADDEGASYWESVYGQPIHVYSAERVGPTGELEQMTEDEYAAYVRQRMWEKTNAGLLEERARRGREQQEKERRRGREQQEEERRRTLERDMEQSLGRGEERREKRRWAAQWNAYRRAWAAWDGTVETLAWPVEGLTRGDTTEKRVRAFYTRGLLGGEGVGRGELVSKLKEERVRWHPDKMQQRLGGEVDGGLMRDVTGVFQIIDGLWADVRGRA